MQIRYALMISDKLFVIGYFLLLLLIPLNYFFNKARIIFQPLENSPIGNYYAILSFLFIFIMVMPWLKRKKHLKRNNVLKFIGLSFENLMNRFVLGLFLGTLFAIITILIRNRDITINVANFHNLPYTYSLSYILIALFLEELFYRGLLITRLRYIFDDNKIWNCFVLSSSAFMFAWIHPIPYYRLVGGFGFGFVYIWKKDLLLAMIAHAVTNTFLILSS